jgi:hypothetical protein
MQKTTVTNLLTQTALAVTLAAALVGCKSSDSNHQQGSATGTRVFAAADRISEGKGKIDAALTPLNDMIGNPQQADLATKFKAYATAVGDLQSSIDKANGAVDKVKKNGDEYFAAWDQRIAAIQNPDIKSSSSERKAAIMKDFEGIKTSYQELSTTMKPFMSNLKDIQTALGTDLTAGGIGAVKDPAKQANKQGESIKDTLDKLAGQFREVGEKMGGTMKEAPSGGSGTNAPAK